MRDKGAYSHPRINLCRMTSSVLLEIVHIDRLNLGRKEIVSLLQVVCMKMSF
jgi:hypothetical protein